MCRSQFFTFSGSLPIRRFRNQAVEFRPIQQFLEAGSFLGGGSRIALPWIRNASGEYVIGLDSNEDSSSSSLIEEKQI